MRVTFAAVIAWGLCALVAVAAGAASTAPAREDLTLRLLPLESAAGGGSEVATIMPLGAISAAGSQARRRGVATGERVAVRLDSPSGRVTSARLYAYLGSETSGCTVRIDGVPLTTVPLLLDAVHRVGVSVPHRVEVVVSPDAPEGALLADIQWLAESD